MAHKEKPTLEELLKYISGEDTEFYDYSQSNPYKEIAFPAVEFEELHDKDSMYEYFEKQYLGLYESAIIRGRKSVLLEVFTDLIKEKPHLVKFALIYLLPSGALNYLRKYGEIEFEDEYEDILDIGGAFQGQIAKYIKEYALRNNTISFRQRALFNVSALFSNYIKVLVDKNVILNSYVGEA